MSSLVTEESRCSLCLLATERRSFPVSFFWLLRAIVSCLLVADESGRFLSPAGF